MNRLLIVSLMVGLLLMAAGVTGSTASAARKASPNANVVYITFPAELGPWCVAGILPNGKIYIANGVETVTLRYNQKRGGYDQYIVAGATVAIQPNGVQKIAQEPCLFVP